MISRECIYFINLRQAYLLAPHNARRLSSRTVLFTCVPRRFLDEARVRKLFGDPVKNIWIPRNTRALRKLVEEREKTAVKLEKAEIALIKAANIARNKQLAKLPPAMPPAVLLSPLAAPTPRSDEKKGGHLAAPKQDELELRPRSRFREELTELDLPSPSSDVQLGLPSPSSVARLNPSSSGSSSSNAGDKLDGSRKPDDGDAEYTHPYGLDPGLPDLRGSVAAQWIPAEQRPVAPAAGQLRPPRRHHPVDAAAAADAQRADRPHPPPLPRRRRPAPQRRLRRVRFAGRRPGGLPDRGPPPAPAHVAALRRHPAAGRCVVVPSHALVGAHRAPLHDHGRNRRRYRLLVHPAAFVGIASNINFLSSKVPFLGWIQDLPSAITGVIQGLLPALALSLLMSIVPVLLRSCATAAGVPSYAAVELFVQNAYMVFQVVQVFLITTLTSAASAAFTKILQDPLSTKDLLSQNLPKASNFYLSYVLVQCLAGGAWGMVHALDLFRHGLLARTMEHPTRLGKTWRKLRPVHWGAIFPVFTNMVVIGKPANPPSLPTTPS